TGLEPGAGVDEADVVEEQAAEIEEGAGVGGAGGGRRGREAEQHQEHSPAGKTCGVHRGGLSSDQLVKVKSAVATAFSATVNWNSFSPEVSCNATSVCVPAGRPAMEYRPWLSVMAK